MLIDAANLAVPAMPCSWWVRMLRSALPLAVALFPLAACMDLGTGTDGGTAPTATAPSGQPEAGPGGSDCLQNSAATITLCAQITSCPGVTVDRGAYPDCGFRMGAGAVLDVECVCDDQLCPVGVAASCSQAGMLLDGQSEITVCQQVNESRCVSLGGGADAGGSGTCDTQCRSECSGDPNCLQLCGC
jgi:hypothetical protein